jgi:hypothetical protein
MCSVLLGFFYKEHKDQDLLQKPAFVNKSSGMEALSQSLFESLL